MSVEPTESVELSEPPVQPTMEPATEPAAKPVIDSEEEAPHGKGGSKYAGEPAEPPLPDLTSDRSAAVEHPLSVLLDGHEIATLHSHNPPVDSSKYTVVTLPVTAQIRVSERLEDGRYAIGLQVIVPPGFFRESRVIDPRRGGSPLDNALGMLPAVRLVVAIDRLSPATQAEIQRQINQAVAHQVLDAPDA